GADSGEPCPASQRVEITWPMMKRPCSAGEDCGKTSPGRPARIKKIILLGLVPSGRTGSDGSIQGLADPEEDRAAVALDEEAGDRAAVGEGLAEAGSVAHWTSVNVEDDVAFAHSREVGGAPQVDGGDSQALQARLLVYRNPQRFRVLTGSSGARRALL